MKQKIALTLGILLLIFSCVFSTFAGGYDGEEALILVPEAAPVSEETPVPYAELCGTCYKGYIHYFKQVKNEDWSALSGLYDCTHSVGHKHRIERATISVYYQCDESTCQAVTIVQNYDFYYRTYCYYLEQYLSGAIKG